MGRNYRRILEIIVGKSTAGTGVTANQSFRMTFEICKTIRHTPNQARVNIYNLAPATENQIRNEFDEILVNAGYAGSSLLIFAGNIQRFWRYRETNDHITELRAGDGDEDYNNTIIHAAFEAGTSDLAVLNHIEEKFKRVKLGDTSLVSTRARPRGKTISGLAREEIHKIAESVDVHWSIQDHVVQFVPVDGTLPDQAIVIRADTGMLKAPEVGNKGIKVWCQLNPAIKPGGKIHLDNNDLHEHIRTERERKAGVPKRKKTAVARLDPDGIYRVDKVTHRGDTRDNEWMSEVICSALGTPISPDSQGTTLTDG